MKRTTKLGSLLNLTKNSFNSLCYDDWSTSVQSFPEAAKTAKKALNKNEKREKDKGLDNETGNCDNPLVNY